MNFDLSVVTTNAIVLVPIIVAIVQAIKLTGWVKEHFAPLLAIVIGVIIGWLGDHSNPDLTSTLLTGTVYGLMASGLYSGVKTTMQAHQQMKAKEQMQQQNKTNPNNRGNC
jgi:F0F1-type ATP synthase assembly protein I